MAEPGATVSSADVLIIGAGLSGLVLAYRLRQQGIRVSLVEQRLRAGGTIQSVSQGDFLAEAEVRDLVATPTLLELIVELGLRESLVSAQIQPLRYLWSQQKLSPFPTNWLTLLATPLLSPQGKLRCLGEVTVPRRLRHEEENIREFITRRCGEEVANILIAPFISFVYGGDPGQLSVQATLPDWASLEQSKGRLLDNFFRRYRKTFSPLISFRQGLQELVIALRKTLDAQFFPGQEVVLLTANETGGYRVEFQSGQILIVPTLVLATPAYVGATLLKDLAAPLARKLSSIYYPPLASVSLAYPQVALSHPLNGWGHLIGRPQGLNTLGAVWASSLFPQRAPVGWQVLTSLLGGTLDAQVQDLDEEDLIRLAHGDLQKIFGIRQEPKVLLCHRQERSYPQFCLGHTAKITYIENLLTKLPGLFLCHNYLSGSTLNDAVVQAQKTAQVVQQYCQQVPSKTP